MKGKSSLLLIIIVLMVGVFIVGGTYAWLNIQANVTNTNYVGVSDCFLVDYDINNGDNTQDITGTLVPSMIPTNGLTGRVGLKTSASCHMDGIGSLKLHINDTSASHITEIATSHCEDKKTGDILTNYSTASSCSAANQKWKEYPSSYCEDIKTLQVLKNYTTSSSCTSNGGIWVSTASQQSPLKYAIYNTSSVSASIMPISAGKIFSSDIGNDIEIANGIAINSTQKYYYIYIWLDGNLTDNTHTDLPFGGYINASAVQGKYYYAFGNPTTSSPTDYNEIYQNGAGHKIFVRVSEDNISNPNNAIKEACIVRNGKLGCFPNGISTWQETGDAIQSFFSDLACTVSASSVNCHDELSRCNVLNTGFAGCAAYKDNSFCDIYVDGAIVCY